jgi:hypothetical protein
MSLPDISAGVVAHRPQNQRLSPACTRGVAEARQSPGQ